MRTYAVLEAIVGVSGLAVTYALPAFSNALVLMMVNHLLVFSVGLLTLYSRSLSSSTGQRKRPRLRGVHRKH